MQTHACFLSSEYGRICLRHSVLQAGPIFSRNCSNSHLFRLVTCLYSQLPVTALRFYYLFDSCITFSSQRGHSQPFILYTQITTNAVTVKAVWTDGRLKPLRKMLRSLFIVASSYVRGMHL